MSFTPSAQFMTRVKWMGTIVSVALFAVACPSVEPECFGDSECDDGVFCNGAESCRVSKGAGVCVDGEPLDCAGSFDTCGGVCDEASRGCVVQDPGMDADGDGHINSICGTGGDDCDDTDASRYPGATEVCDGDDEDCNPLTFGHDADADGDGYESDTCCNDGACGADCDDSHPAISPSGFEACNGVDDDCDGAVDEDVSVSLFVDSDGDGYGAPGNAVVGCPGQVGFSLLDNDCDDDNAAVTPGSMVCVSGAPSQINVCSDNGVFVAEMCPMQGSCRPQVNGTGFCF